MKIGAVSGDLAVKLALAGIAVAGVLYLVKRGRAALPGLAGAVNPANPDNLANQAATGAVSAAVGYQETVGGWLYDLTHRDPVATPPTVIDYSAGNPMVSPDGRDYSYF